MYSFNTSLSTPPLLGVGLDFGSNTPRTPEILNSLIAMTNPFEYSSYASVTSQAIPSSIDVSPVITCKTESFLHHQDNSSSSSSMESPSETPLQMAASISSTPSLQQVRINTKNFLPLHLKKLFIFVSQGGERGRERCEKES